MISRTCLVAMVGAVMLCTGCAVFNCDNTPVLNFVEDRLLPEAKSARYFVYPLLLPAGLAAVAIDGVILRPISVADDAALDTKELLWEYFNWKERYVTECVLLIPRTALTPVVLGADFLGRTMLDVDPREAEPPPAEDDGPLAQDG